MSTGENPFDALERLEKESGPDGLEETEMAADGGPGNAPPVSPPEKAAVGGSSSCILRKCNLQELASLRLSFCKTASWKLALPCE